MPLPLLEKYKIYYTFKRYDESYVFAYNPNDFFVVIAIFRFFYSFSYFDKIFEYNSNASYRIIKILGNNINISFFIRCLFEEKALKTVFTTCLITIFIFSYIIRIFEFDNPFNDFSNFYNAIWFSVVTMVTVGYGDYTPVTIYGRIFSFILGVVGIIVTYLITVILTEKFFLKTNEELALR